MSNGLVQSTAAEQWLQHAEQFVEQNIGYASTVETDDAFMMPADIEQIRVDPATWLDYFVHWMGNLNSLAGKWNSISDYLEQKYKTEYGKTIQTYLTTEKSITKAEYYARAALEGLADAKTIASGRARKAMAEYYRAQSYKEEVSRTITVLEMERGREGYTT